MEQICIAAARHSFHPNRQFMPVRVCLCLPTFNFWWAFSCVYLVGKKRVEIETATLSNQEMKRVEIIWYRARARAHDHVCVYKHLW